LQKKTREEGGGGKEGEKGGGGHLEKKLSNVRNNLIQKSLEGESRKERGAPIKSISFGKKRKKGGGGLQVSENQSLLKTCPTPRGNSGGEIEACINNANYKGERGKIVVRERA